MKAKDVMTKNVVYVTLPNNRGYVLELFKKYGISAVPVLKDGKLVGIVTRKDILRKIEEDQLALLMTPNPVSVQVEDSIEKVVKVFLEHDFHRLPVLEGDKLVGIITIMDLLKVIAKMDINKSVKDYITYSTVCIWEETPLNIAAEIMRVSNSALCPVLNSDAHLVGLIDEKIMLTETLIEEFIEKTQYASSSDTDDTWTWDGIRDYTIKYFEISVVKLPKEPVKKFMKPPAYVYPQTSVSKCAKEMVKHDIDQIPVLDANNRLIGMITGKNLIKVLIK
ncbi:MAG TPA: CBS domain-containing protein [Archaeoglobus profundus]|nr:CBS domain-containing protein [Archaeoglobus profundus]HIP57911.1 CBS domain-containing protein [Archaeoglobus profundus]